MTPTEDPVSTLATGMVRKLAAILSADVEGYSRLMRDNEAATIRTLTTYRAIIDGLVQHHRGRTVDSTGDNLLAEFPSVIDAVQCAVAIQRALQARNAPLPPERQMRFRLGINVGDVVVDGDRIYGDGVNIAARLEGLAKGGGICIAGSVYEQIKAKLPLDYDDMGLQVVKNIAEPIRAYRVRTESGTAAGPFSHFTLRALVARWRRALPTLAVLLLVAGAAATWHFTSRPVAERPTKPSIAVLPFVNMSGDPEQEYFSDGMTEDLITELSSLTGLFVIARNSVFTYKGKAVRPEQVSRELGVQYLLEGSVRKANNRIRINAQLIDAKTGYHMWAQYYDRDLQDIFAVQDEIARVITKALEVRLTMEERTQMGRPYTSSQVAWEYFMRGSELYRRFTPKDNAQARELFERAIAQDPEFSRAYANLAATYRQDGNMEWTKDRDTSEALSFSMATKAVELAEREFEPKPSLPYALEQLGYVLLYRRQHAEALKAAGDAVRQNPNYADGYALWAHALIYSGKPDEALRKTDQAIALNPKYPFFYDYHRGHAYWLWGFQMSARDPAVSRQYFLEAEKYLRTATTRNANFRPARAYLVAVLSELGRLDDAKNEMLILRNAGRPQAFQDLQRFNDYIYRSIPYQDQRTIQHLVELWKAAETPPK